MRSFYYIKVLLLLAFLFDFISCSKHVPEENVLTIHQIIAWSHTGNVKALLGKVDSSSALRSDTESIARLIRYVNNKYRNDFEVVSGIVAKNVGGGTLNIVWISSSGRNDMIRFDFLLRDATWLLQSYLIKQYADNDFVGQL